MAAKKTDWNYHIQNYLEQHAGSMTVPDYARANGLNINSARRSMGPVVAAAMELRKQSVDGEQVKISDSGTKLGKTVRRKARELATEARNKRVLSDQPKTDQPTDHPETDHLTGQPGNQKSSKQISDNQNKPQLKPNAVKKREGDTYTSGFTGGLSPEKNSQTRKTTRPKNANYQDFGGYADFLEFDLDIQAHAIAVSGSDEDLVISTGRHLTMIRAQARLLKKIGEDYSAGRPWTDDAGNVMSESQALAQTIFGPSQRMTELEAHIGRRKLGLKKLELERDKLELERSKLQFAAREAHPLTRAERLELTGQIMRQRQNENLTAIEVARLFEQAGITIPESVRAELNKEVSWMEPAIEADGGISEEELDRIAREYQEKKRYDLEVWLPARIAAVEEMVKQEAAYQAGELMGEDAFHDPIDKELVGDGGGWSPDDSLPDDEDSLNEHGEPTEIW